MDFMWNAAKQLEAKVEQTHECLSNTDMKKVPWNMFEKKNGNVARIGYSSSNGLVVWIFWTDITTWGRNVIKQQQAQIGVDWIAFQKSKEANIYVDQDYLKSVHPLPTPSNVADDVSSMDTSLDGRGDSMNMFVTDKFIESRVGYFGVTVEPVVIFIRGQRIVVPTETLCHVQCDQKNIVYGQFPKPYEKYKWYKISKAQMNFRTSDTVRSAKKAYKRFGKDIGLPFKWTFFSQNEQQNILKYWKAQKPIQERPKKRLRAQNNNLLRINETQDCKINQTYNMNLNTLPISSRTNINDTNINDMNNNNDTDNYSVSTQTYPITQPTVANVDNNLSPSNSMSLSQDHHLLSPISRTITQRNEDNIANNYDTHSSTSYQPSLSTVTTNSDNFSRVSGSNQFVSPSHISQQSNRLTNNNNNNCSHFLSIPLSGHRISRVNQISINELQAPSSQSISQQSTRPINSNNNIIHLPPISSPSTSTNTISNNILNNNNVNANISNQVTDTPASIPPLFAARSNHNNSNDDDNNSIELLITQPTSNTTHSHSSRPINNNLNNIRSNPNQPPSVQSITQLINNNNDAIDTDNNSNQIVRQITSPLSNDEKDKRFGNWYENKRGPALAKCRKYNMYQYGQNYRYPHYKKIANELAVENPQLFQFLTPKKLQKQFESQLALVIRKIKNKKTNELKQKSQQDLIPYAENLKLDKHMTRMKDGQTLKEIEEKDKENLAVALKFVAAKKKKQIQLQKEKDTKNAYYESGIHRNKQWADAAGMKMDNTVDEIKGAACSKVRKYFPKNGLTNSECDWNWKKAISHIRNINNTKHILYRAVCSLLQEIKAAEKDSLNSLNVVEEKNNNEKDVMADIVQENVELMWKLMCKNKQSNQNVVNVNDNDNGNASNAMQLDENIQTTDNMNINNMLMEVSDDVNNRVIASGNRNNISVNIQNASSIGLNDANENGNKVKEWLTSLRMHQYYDTFVEKGFTSMDMVKLIDGKDELEKMGVLQAHKLLLYANIKKLQNN
eukprot:470022_1